MGCGCHNHDAQNEPVDYAQDPRNHAEIGHSYVPEHGGSLRSRPGQQMDLQGAQRGPETVQGQQLRAALHADEQPLALHERVMTPADPAAVLVEAAREQTSASGMPVPENVAQRSVAEVEQELAAEHVHGQMERVNPAPATASAGCACGCGGHGGQKRPSGQLGAAPQGREELGLRAAPGASRAATPDSGAHTHAASNEPR